MKNSMKIVVIDGQGGNIGKQLVKSIKESFPDVYVRAVGTNSAATSNMLKSGADEGATSISSIIHNATSTSITWYAL